MHLEFGVKEQVVFIGNFTIHCECWSKLITTGQEYTEEPRASKPIVWFVAVIHCFVTLKFPCPCVIIVTCSCCKLNGQRHFSCPCRRYPDCRGCFDAQGFLQRRKRLLQLALLFPVCNQAQTRGHNRPFYRYGGHIELIRCKEHDRMPRGHEHILFVFSSAFPDNFS